MFICTCLNFHIYLSYGIYNRLLTCLAFCTAIKAIKNGQTNKNVGPFNSLSNINETDYDCVDLCI